MRLLGNFGRYGVQPFRISYETGDEDDDNNVAEEAYGVPMMRCMAYHTLTGGHFDGELRFSVEETTKDDSGAVVVSCRERDPRDTQRRSGSARVSRRGDGIVVRAFHRAIDSDTNGANPHKEETGQGVPKAGQRQGIGEAASQIQAGEIAGGDGH